MLLISEPDSVETDRLREGIALEVEECDIIFLLLFPLDVERGDIALAPLAPEFWGSFHGRKSSDDFLEFFRFDKTYIHIFQSMTIARCRQY